MALLPPVVLAPALAQGTTPRAGAVEPAQAGAGDGLDGYMLSPFDTLALSVARWDPSTGELVGVEWLTGEHRIGGDGSVGLPLIGAVDAASMTRGALAREVARRLSRELGIADGLYVSLNIVKHAPFFVVGAVESPGEYEFRPGLRVFQAVALAGGPPREQTLFSRTERDATRALGDHRLLKVERWRELARLARLEAELAGEDVVATPAELADVELADQLLEVEREILIARRDDFNSSLAAIEELKALLEQRIEKLREEVALREELLSSTREEQASVEQLVERGLSRRSAANDVSRELAELEARLLELETTILTAEQQISEAERDRLDLIGDRRVAIITELQNTRTELNSIAVQLETAESLFAEAARFGTTIEALNEGRDTGSPVYKVTRTTEVGTTTEVVDLEAQLRAGDVLLVEPPDLDASGAVSELARQRLGAGPLSSTAFAAPQAD
ncbi:SLBB domain-containing protein [Acuticoccus sp.]|uniref:SLBB domain-containing protein n=1 Tax=Acuticoccus sp. TaxID=1904378 RepID=UPI003B515C6A